MLPACCVLFGAAIISDLVGRWIPDSIPLALLILFVLYALTGGHLAPVWTHLAIGAVLLLDK